MSKKNPPTPLCTCQHAGALGHKFDCPFYQDYRQKVLDWLVARHLPAAWVDDPEAIKAAAKAEVDAMKEQGGKLSA